MMKMMIGTFYMTGDNFLYENKKKEMKKTIQNFFKNPISKSRSLRHPVVADLSRGSSITNDEVRTLIEKQMGANKTNSNIFVFDREYTLVQRSKFEKFVKADGTNHLMYKLEGRDCDNYGRVIDGRIQHHLFLVDASKGLTFGSVAGMIYENKNSDEPVNHYLNIVIFESKNGPVVRLYEPQNDMILKPDPRNTYYFIGI